MLPANSVDLTHKPGAVTGPLSWLLQRKQLLLVMMFTLLHLNLAGFVPSALSRVPLLLHFALFLLWQPFVSTRSKISAPHLVWLAAGVLIAIFGVTWPLRAIWLVLLAGIVGGRVFLFSQRKTKIFYLFALTYLIVMLLFQVMPQIVPRVIEIEPLILSLARYGAPVLIAAMALLPESPEKEESHEAIDLVYSMFIMLVLAVLVLGSASMMLLRQVAYVQALLSMVFVMAAMLLAASWLWNPASGFSRLGAIASRYMLSIGLPFEQWLRSLADLAQSETDPERFLDSACRDMAQRLPWISSCTWAIRTDPVSPGLERRPAHKAETVFREGELELTLATQQPLAPMMVWHFNLVAQLIAKFYFSKKRDRELRDMAYMQAVHETGARMTHDVKNLLQSLNALLFVIDRPGDDPSGTKAQPLLRRQLPLIAQRLQQTLEKLSAPDAGTGETVAAGTWWRDLCARYETRAVRFESCGDMDKMLPEGFFNSAAENLLQNAFDKRAGEPGIDIVATLDMRGPQPVLTVTDTGAPLSDRRAADIGVRPVASENGLGIGLYQLARLATMLDYVFELSANRQGEVSFRLKPKTAAQ